MQKDYPYMIPCDWEIWQKPEVMYRWMKLVNGSGASVYLESKEYDLAVRLSLEDNNIPVCYFTFRCEESMQDEECLHWFYSDNRISNEFVHMTDFIDILIKLFS